MQHKEIKETNVHIIHNMKFSTTTERDSYMPTQEDLYKICLVMNPYHFFSLKSLEPIEWELIGNQTVNTIQLKNGVETLAGWKRNGKDVYQMEIDCGTFPNTTSKMIAIPNFNTSYTYWIDHSKSYVESNNFYASVEFLNSRTCYIDKIGYQIVLYASSDQSTYNTTKVVINYTK